MKIYIIKSRLRLFCARAVMRSIYLLLREVRIPRSVLYNRKSEFPIIQKNIQQQPTVLYRKSSSDALIFRILIKGQRTALCIGVLSKSLISATAPMQGLPVNASHRRSVIGRELLLYVCMYVCMYV